MRRLRSERKAIVGLVIIALLALVAIFGPMLAPYHPDTDDFGMLQHPACNIPWEPIRSAAISSAD